jgi:fatty acid synthase subunit beta
MASLFGSVTSTAPSTRPLVLQIHSTRLSVPISASTDSWIAAEVIREEFYHSRSTDEVEPAVIAGEDEAADLAAAEQAAHEAEVKLLARFISFVDSKITSATKSDASDILLSSFERFNELFLASSSVHTLTQSFAADDRALVLAAYFKAFSTLREIYGSSKVPVAHKPSIWKVAEEGKAKVYALFGGQGSNEVRFLFFFL